MKRKKGTWRLPQAKDVHIDIDKYINPFVPPSQLYRLPKPIARFLGYRETPPPELGNVLLAFWSLLGAFCGLFLVGAVFHYSDQILQYHPPVVFGSLVRSTSKWVAEEQGLTFCREQRPYSNTMPFSLLWLNLVRP